MACYQTEELHKYRIIIADGKVIKNNTGMTDTEALTAEPWQIPPVGYRLVTQEERGRYGYPNEGIGGGSIVKWNCGVPIGWELSTGPTYWNPNEKYQPSEHYFAVPEDYVFEKPVKEISAEEAMRQLAEIHGCEVKLTK